MTLLKTYLVAVARVCEFGLFGGYLEASIISQLNLDELEKDPPQLRFSKKRYSNIFSRISLIKTSSESPFSGLQVLVQAFFD